MDKGGKPEKSCGEGAHCLQGPCWAFPTQDSQVLASGKVDLLLLFSGESLVSRRPLREFVSENYGVT